MGAREFDLLDTKILIIDDRRSMRAIVRSILSQLSCLFIRDVGGAASAFEEMQGFPCDLIIVDWNMEPLDGLDFVRLVRTATDSRNPFVPIIMLSGHTEFIRVAVARDAGLNEFLAKPCSVQQMRSRIHSVFKNPRPFIRGKKYFGPCRRRMDSGPPHGKADRRIKGPEAMNPVQQRDKAYGSGNRA